MTDKLSLTLDVGLETGSNVLVMLFLMGIGFLFTKKGLLTNTGVKQITELVLRGAVPCLIINSYQRAFDPLLAKNLLFAILIAVIVHIFYIISAKLLFKKRDDNRDRVSKFSVIYSNCGFMALPLIEGLYGGDGVFYAVAYVTVFNILYWTHGVYVYTGNLKELSLKKAFLNPGVLGAAVGLGLFFTGVTLPVPVGKTVGFVASLNTPLPMIILGTYLVNLKLGETLKNGSLWGVTALRLLVLPVCTVFIISLFNLEGIISMPLILAGACPVAAVATLFAVRYEGDSEYASQCVSLTTLLSVITIPLIMMISTLIL